MCMCAQGAKRAQRRAPGVQSKSAHLLPASQCARLRLCSCSRLDGLSARASRVSGACSRACSIMRLLAHTHTHQADWWRATSIGRDDCGTQAALPRSICYARFAARCCKCSCYLSHSSCCSRARARSSSRAATQSDGKLACSSTPEHELVRECARLGRPPRARARTSDKRESQSSGHKGLAGSGARER